MKNIVDELNYIKSSTIFASNLKEYKTKLFRSGKRDRPEGLREAR
jgi:hypothetical protein